MQKEDAAHRQRQHSVVVGKIGGKKEDEQDLAELRWLHRECAERNPILIAADTHAEDQRQQQNCRRRESQHIGIGKQAAQAPPQKHRRPPAHSADACPAQLCGK